MEVKILKGLRKGAIGKVTGTEDTLVGPLDRVEFPSGEAGLYEKKDYQELKLITPHVEKTKAKSDNKDTSPAGEGGEVSDAIVPPSTQKAKKVGNKKSMNKGCKVKASQKKVAEEKRDIPPTASIETNPYGANQFLLDPRQAKCWAAYVDPTSKTFANAKQSAIAAGYDEEYAGQITTSQWFLVKLRRIAMVAKAEEVFHSTLNISTLVPVMGAFGPIVDKETKEPVMKIDHNLLRIQNDTAKFVAETQGKTEGYTKRTELAGKDGQPISFEIVNYGDKKETV